MPAPVRWSTLKDFPFESVVQMHLAGHQHCETHIVDTHDQPVCDGVWELFRFAWQKTHGVSTLLEWDGDVPEFERVHQEVLKARDFMQGEIDQQRLQSLPQKNLDAISNPLDFIVTDVRDKGQYQHL